MTKYSVSSGQREDILMRRDEMIRYLRAFSLPGYSYFLSEESLNCFQSVISLKICITVLLLLLEF